MTETIELFVGCAPNGEDAESQMVLEYTAKKNSSLPVNIHWMKHSIDPKSFWYGWDSRTWATPFSGFRWGIPEFQAFKGQAIYMDSDMLILGDLAELWNEPWNDTAIIMGKGGWRFCVAKWNCERAKQVLPPVDQIRKTPQAHQQLAHQLPQHPHLEQIFDRQWNNFDGENDNLDDIKILHYTDMSTQMHLLKYALPRLESMGMKHWFDGQVRAHRRADVQELFDALYNEALDAGYKAEQYIPRTVIEYAKESQVGYRSNNGFDVTQGQ
jgi:hypothetical protein